LSSPPSAASGAQVTLTAVVSSASGTPTGTVTFHSGTASLGTGTLNNVGVATLSTTALPVGTDTVTASYAGSGSFAASSSPAVTVTITSTVARTPATYTVAANPTSLTIAAGQAGNTTLILTPQGDYSGNIALGCLNLPANMTCAFTQNQVALKGDNQAATMPLTIKLSAQNAAILRSPLSSTFLAMVFWWPGGLTGLAVFASRRKLLRAQLCLLIAGTLALTAGLSGCGMSGIASAAPGTAEVTVFATGTSASAVTTQTVILTIRTMQ
jgi:Bacterial Ig-like domain (group 3)